jgi:hypothetical protein
MTEATIPMQTTIACNGCGAALAPDQRYCLHCGAAHGGPRVAYRELIGAAVGTDAETVAPASAPAAGSTPPARDWTPLLTLGTLAGLALVLVVGVLIGRSGWDAAPASAPAPQVITVGGVAPGGGAADAGAGADEASGPSGRGSGRTHGKADRALQQKAASDQQVLRDLESTSGADYQRRSARLPDTVALPGEPPPRDDKAPGAGSDAETIG